LKFLIILFFVTFLFHLFIILSFIYSFFELLFVQAKQGFKLNIKKNYR